MHQGYRPLVEFLLVEELVLNHVHVDKVSHVGASVPTGVVGIDVDLTEHAHHLSLVADVGLGTRGSGGRIGSGVVKVRLGGHLDNGERERVGDLQGTIDVHTNERTGRGSRESLGAVLDDFHHHLEESSMSISRCRELGRFSSCREGSYQSLDLDGREGGLCSVKSISENSQATLLSSHLLRHIEGWLHRVDGVRLGLRTGQMHGLCERSPSNNFLLGLALYGGPGKNSKAVGNGRGADTIVLRASDIFTCSVSIRT